MLTSNVELESPIIDRKWKFTWLDMTQKCLETRFKLIGNRKFPCLTEPHPQLHRTGEIHAILNLHEHRDHDLLEIVDKQKGFTISVNHSNS